MPRGRVLLALCRGLRARVPVRARATRHDARAARDRALPVALRAGSDPRLHRRHRPRAQLAPGRQGARRATGGAERGRTACLRLPLGYAPNRQMEPCSDFTSPELAADCVAAVQLECLVFTDVLTRFASARGIAQPQCRLPEPPMNGYWAAMRRDLLARPMGKAPDTPRISEDTDLRACQPVLSACYPRSS